MGDMGEFWRDVTPDMKKRSSEKRENNRQFSTELLKASGFDVESKNQGYHLIVKHNNKVADFWPSTGKFTVRGSNKYSRGVKNLIKQLDK